MGSSGPALGVALGHGVERCQSQQYRVAADGEDESLSIGSYRVESV